MGFGRVTPKFLGSGRARPKNFGSDNPYLTQGAWKLKQTNIKQLCILIVKIKKKHKQ
jgi:hypothetical protein